MKKLVIKKNKKLMKKLFLTILIILSAIITKAQDKIITNNNDTIFCRIVGISETKIIYEQQNNERQIIGKFISVDDVLEYYKETQLSNYQNNTYQDNRINNESKEIIILKQGMKTQYFQNGLRLYYDNLLYLSRANNEMYKQIRNARKFNVVANCFYYGGGFLIGWAFGGMLVSLVKEKQYNWNLGLTYIGLGSVFLIAGVPFEGKSKKCIEKGINIYNNSKRVQNNMSFNFSFSGNGIGLRLNF